MLVRAIALSLAILVGVGVIIPIATDTTEAGPHRHRSRKHVSKYRKYSKGWWREYRARMKRRRAIAARRRALRLHELRLAKAAEAAKAEGGSSTAAVKPARPDAKTAVLPSGDKAPNGWKPAQTSAAELQFRVDNPGGDQVGLKPSDGVPA